MALHVAFVYHQHDLFNLYDSAEEPHKEKMIELSERTIGQEIVYADGIDFPKLNYVDYSDGRLLTENLSPEGRYDKPLP